MSYELIIERKARKALARLPQRIYDRVMEGVYALAEDPYPRSSRKLQNTENRRLRVGEYRVIYFVGEAVEGDEPGTVYVLDVGHRQGIYG
ncbi:MAG: type II toxin-antitoxin system RelE/ParE family toxin [Rubrobacter sp.]|nr:type II toxin-antitoxin system RelE/ParE family toxin [Rubrobacter sp.]